MTRHAASLHLSVLGLEISYNIAKAVNRHQTPGISTARKSDECQWLRWLRCVCRGGAERDRLVEVVVVLGRVAVVDLMLHVLLGSYQRGLGKLLVVT